MNPGVESGLRVLVVDDEQPARDELAFQLGRLDEVDEVLGAAEGTECLRLLEGGDLDAVFLDVRMPGLDGLELGRIVRLLARPPMLYAGKPRHVILSEQGFHTPDGVDGERIQAAAFAYAYCRIDRIAGIDAFILHRQVEDFPASASLERSLRLGELGVAQEPRLPESPRVRRRRLAVVGKELAVFGPQEVPHLRRELGLDAAGPEGHATSTRSRAATSCVSSVVISMKPPAA